MNPYLHPLCGLFLQIPKRNRLKLEHDFVSFDNPIPSKRSTAFTIGSNAGRNADILQSCNACWTREGDWSVCPTTFVLRGFQHGIYWNGAIHWLTLYEPSKHFKLDAVNEHPVEDAHSQQLNIYEMRNSYSEWSMKYDHGMLCCLSTVQICSNTIFHTSATNPYSLAIAGSSSKVVRVDDNVRASKEQTKDISDNELPSSISAVVSNADLLIEILHRLSVISPRLFKSVSKQ
nr:hypothetical protein [Tanacetum cinerariifolium]